ncbi:TonB-dependent receptor [Desertivirga xinjiangensis]|uniref:TonB-dependent receptor n=1 Tax=Desertivirga xinjiangensis TaxID=539206 RepID=UPI00210C48D5|nr:TonB-dependent receptor [Pedobacter xinjiangensis]
MIVSLMQVSAASFAQRISLSQKKISLEKVFREIHNQTGYDFLYDKQLLSKRKPVNVNVSNESLEEVLEHCLEGQALEYKIEERTVVIREKKESIIERVIRELRAIDIRGRVTDSVNVPLAGVTVQIKGANRGTVTDEKGEFYLQNVEEGAVLVLSYISFKTREIVVEKSDFLTIKLSEENRALNEVVVVGYGTQKKVNVTGSVETVTEKQIAGRAQPDISNLLTGQVPGLTIVQNSGQPGRDGGTLRIRGIGTLGNNEPLVIVDGIESGYSNIEPNDIESVSVLKDASASAIYGVRAANGVLLITTRRGKTGKPTINYNNYFGAQNATRLPDYANSADYAFLYNEALTNDGGTPLYSAEDIQKYRDGSDPDNYPNSDWVGSLFSEAGFQQNHYLGINGGSENTRYNLSFGYLDRNGLVVNTSNERYTMRVNFDQDFSKRFKVRVNLSGSRQSIVDPSMNLGDLVHRAYRESPTATIRYSNGNWGGYPYDHNSTAIARDGGYQNTFNNIFISSLNAEYELLKGLKLRGIAGVTNNTYKYHGFTKNLQLYNNNDVTTTYRSYVGDARSETMELNLQAFLDYDRSFSGMHNVSALVGYNQISNDYDEITAGIYDLPSDSQDQLNAGNKATVLNSGNASDYRLRSYFGRLKYNFKERYLLEGNFRYDGTSRFPKDNRYGFFPSFSAGWNISREPFFPSVRWIDNIKIRGSWGQLGNQEIGNYAFLPTYALGINYTFGGTLSPGIAENSSLANETISWETSTETNIGLDADIFKGRLSITAEYYSRDTEDILLNLPQPSTLGGYPPTINAGAVSNKGFDFIVRHQNQIGKAGYWINGNFSYVKNRITDLAGGDTPGRSVGDPINNIYGYVAMGLFQSAEEIENAPDQTATFGGAQPGDIRYVDISGPDKVPDGIIDTYDRKSLGSSFPKVSYGFQLGANYRSFDFSFNAQGVSKVSNYLGGQAIQPFPNMGKALNAHFDRWTPENPNAAFPRISLSAASRNYGSVNSFFVKDASYLRIRNIQAGYSFPAKVLNRIKVSRLRVYLNIDNPFLFTSFYDDFDPEAPAYPTVGWLSYAAGNYYPQVTTITGGINLTF